MSHTCAVGDNNVLHYDSGIYVIFYLISSNAHTSDFTFQLDIDCIDWKFNLTAYILIATKVKSDTSICTFRAHTTIKLSYALCA